MKIMQFGEAGGTDASCKKLSKNFKKWFSNACEVRMVEESLRTGAPASRRDKELLDLRKGGASSQGPLGCVAALTLLEHRQFEYLDTVT